jgi:CheY-like chemotaxis protein
MSHKLLLADDSVTIQRVIELTFADEDVEVAVVGDGKQAIERLSSDRPDIVLADIGMPERDGYEVAAFIKNDPRYSHIPVILLTGAFEPLDEDRARKVGCDGVLVKPFEPQAVINRVRELLSGQRPVTSAAPAAAVAPPAAAWDRLDQLDAAPPPPPPPPPPAPAEPPRSGDALEDYFDRLDAAFANMGAPPSADRMEERHEDLSSGVGELHHPPPQPTPAGEDPMNVWDPDLTSDLGPARQPGLATAFAALLAAEEGDGPPALEALGGPVVSEAMIEDIVRRVIDRMGDSVVRQAVTEVAERLVRQEIERIKLQARGSSTPHAGR